MLAHRTLGRLVGFSRPCFSLLSSRISTNSFKVDKNLLSKLRKETGYPFSKCLDALKASSNQFDDALQWLDLQSQKEGWKKAEKLKGRLTAQGLIGVLVQDNVAAMVEVNCETDFVSRNDLFKDLLAQVTQSAINFKQRVLKQNQLINSLSGEDIAHLREVIPTHELQEAKTESKLLRDSIVSVINQLGENIVLTRAMTIATSKNNVIGAYTHGNTSGTVDDCLYGKYASLVVLGKGELGNRNMEALAKEMAQHVVGMRPDSIDGDVETALLNQDYLLDDKVDVRTVLKKNDTLVVDFVRYQCGE